MVECLIKDTTMTDIADAIRSKNSATATYLPSEMPAAIQAISTLLEETADATATADDIAEGKTAYVGGKEPITGNIPAYSGITMTYDSLTENTDSSVTVKGTCASKVILNANGYASTKIPLTEFGEAASTDVALGKTFTSSEAGLKIAGSLKEGLDINSGSYKISYEIVNGKKFSADRTSAKPADKIIYKTASIGSAGIITLTEPLSETASSFLDQKNNYQEYPYFYGDYGDGSTDSTIYKYEELGQTSVTSGGKKYYYTYYKQHANSNIITLTSTAIEDSIIRKDSSYAIESPIGDLPIANGKYCWKKYRVQKNWEKTTKKLGTSKPAEASSTKYGSYTITDDGYYQLSGTSYLGGYYLPSGATNGATKTIYQYAWSALGSSYYYKWTLGDTCTETLGKFLGYVGSNDSEAYPLGIRDKYWYIPVATLEVTDETLKWGTFRIGEYPLLEEKDLSYYEFDTGLSTITSMTILKYDVNESPTEMDFYWFYGNNKNYSVNANSNGVLSLTNGTISFNNGICRITSSLDAIGIKDGTYVWFARGS